MSKKDEAKPGLFGLKNTNRNFTKPESWGKNQFNNSFPASLACYMGSKKLEGVYLHLDDDLCVAKRPITIETLFGLKELSDNLHFNFESVYAPYGPLAVDNIPRVDLVTVDISSKPFRLLRPIEIKLTALPDNTTAHLTENKYGSEIVVRPDTIVYLGLSIAFIYLEERDKLKSFLDPVCGRIADWEDPEEIYPLINSIADALDGVLAAKLENQSSLIMQPVWKTKPSTNTGELADQCFDLFIWSDFGFTRLFIDAARKGGNKITRHARTAVWLAKMLYDFAGEGRFDHKQIIDKLSYNTKNDKAFAVSGTGTNSYMSCDELTRPRVPKEAVKEIILGGGQNHLSPERRLDAAILSTPGLFD